MNRKGYSINRTGGENIGQLLVVEFNEREFHVFDEVAEILKHHSRFEGIQLNNETVLSLHDITVASVFMPLHSYFLKIV